MHEKSSKKEKKEKKVVSLPYMGKPPKKQGYYMLKKVDDLGVNIDKIVAYNIYVLSIIVFF